MRKYTVINTGFIANVIATRWTKESKFMWFIDFAKAFDRVDQNALLEKNASYFFSKTYIRLICSYLTYH